MIHNLSLLQIFGPALVVGSLFLMAAFIRKNRQNLPEWSKAVDHFKLTSLVFGILVGVLWFSLPQTASLSTFGYPNEVSEIGSEAQVLHYFQTYNSAIVRTTEVVQWFLFLFMWWFLASAYGVAKAFRNSSANTIAKPVILPQV